MTISKFQGRGNAGGVITQNRNAPPYVTQYSGRGSVDQGGQVYSVNNPGAKQTAKREPNKPVPTVDSKSNIQNNVIFYTSRSVFDHTRPDVPKLSIDFHISPWNLIYRIDDVPANYSMELPSPHLVYGHNPANGHFIHVIPVVEYRDWGAGYFTARFTGFIVLEFNQNTVKRTNSYDSFSPPGYEWAKDIMRGNNVSPTNSDYLAKNSAVRYWVSGQLETMPQKLKLKFKADKPHRIYNSDNKEYFIPRMQDYIDANGGSLVFTKTVNKPELPPPFNQPTLFQNTTIWWGFAIKS